MRKLFISILFVLSFVLTGCRPEGDLVRCCQLAENPSWVELDVEWKTIHNQLTEQGYEVGGIYTYYTVGVKDNQIIVARNQYVSNDTGSKTELAVEVRSYTITGVPSREHFEQVAIGMDLFDVIELLGDAPMEADSAIGTWHEDSAGNKYRILWVFDDNFQKLVVGSVDLF